MILVDNIEVIIQPSCVPKTEIKLSVKFISLPPGGPETYLFWDASNMEPNNW